MRIVFAGTPETAIPTLDRMNASHEVVTVITRPDAPRGRKREMTPSAVAEHATQLGLPVIKASRFTDDVITELRHRKPDVGIVVAFGALIPPPALLIPRLGWLNLHFSQLPQWRGASPLQRDIISGAQSAHLTVFELVAELDAGDIVGVRESPLGAHETAGVALNRLGIEGAELVEDVVDRLAGDGIVATPQSGPVSFAPKLSASEAQLTSRSSSENAYNLFRGVTPEPGAWIQSTSGRLKVIDCAPQRDLLVQPGKVSIEQNLVAIGFADGALELSLVQPAGKQIMPAREWVRGIQSLNDWSFE
jgi:methionyl-tRNA formyltransferase